MTDHLTHARDVLEAAGIEVNESRALATGLGHQLRCAGGQVVVIYNTGTVVPQGKDADRVKALFAAAPAPPKSLKRAGPVTAPPAVKAKVMPADQTEAPGETQTRRPANWSEEPWDGTSPPWN